MRIAITADPYIPVPPTLYGGTERIIDVVIQSLLGEKHEVTLFAHAASQVSCSLVSYGHPPHLGMRRQADLLQLGSALWKRRKEYDLVLSWGRLASLVPILPRRKLPKVQFYCRDSVPWRSIRRAATLARGSIIFSGSSNSVYDGLNKHPDGGHWETMYYATDVHKYTFVPRQADDAPLVFLGRIERIKGTHTAIAIAKACGRKLVIAGNRVSGEGDIYFNQEVRPHLGTSISYVGPVNDQQKSELLGSAAALLFPVQSREAFGIVMAEALACGTPIIGYDLGSVPEIVREGVTGFVCRSTEEAVHAVGLVPSLNRADARADCEARFSKEAMSHRLNEIIAMAFDK